MINILEGSLLVINKYLEALKSLTQMPKLSLKGMILFFLF
jgi:hypothetical protein